MVASLISTKLYIPSAKAKLVDRQRLTNRLMAGATCPGTLMLVSGPAGFGKTTLLIEFIQQYGRPVAWVSLDDADNDPIRFWTYFIKACQSIQPGVGEAALDMFRNPQPLPDEVVPTILINEIAGQEHDIVLVLDDYHLIQNQVIHTAISYMLTRLPDNMHIIFSTRVDPPWPLARYRSRGQLVEIRAADLRFTEEEAANFLFTTMGLRLTPEEITSLEARTEGWIAGLQLAAISMSGRSEIDQFIKAFTGSHVFVAEYLVEEVLEQQTPQMQSFLLQSSILDRLTGGLCEVVTGQNRSQTILTELQRKNLFILPLDDVGHWFRYHHLFADLLQARLKQSFSPQEIHALHNRAATWFEQEGMPEEAIVHAQMASDYMLIERMVTKVGLPTILQGYVTTVEDWLHLFPQDHVEKSLKINLVWAWLFLSRGLYDQVQPLLERLTKLFAADKDANDDPSLWGEWLAIQAKHLNVQGKSVESREMCLRALDVLPISATYVRNMVHLELATAYQQSLDYEHAAEIFDMIARNAQTNGDFVVEILGLSGQARMMLTLGKLQRAFEIASQGIERLEITGKVTPFSATLFGEIGSVYFEWHQFDRAKEYFRRSTESSGLKGFSDPKIYQHVALSRMYLMDGNREAAAVEMHTVEDLSRENHPVMTQEGVICQKVRVALANHQLNAAQTLLKEHGFVFESELRFPGLVSGSPITHPTGLLYNSALRYLLTKMEQTSDHAQATIDLATLVLETALRCQLASIALETLLVRSQMQAVLANEKLALADIALALELAVQEGFISIFVEEGERVRRLLTTLLKKRGAGAIQLHFIQKVLKAFPAENPNVSQEVLPETGSGKVSFSGANGEQLITPLTARELEVLIRIAAGDSNQSIAEKLVISVSAVKKHTGNIYSKLSVNSRTQAILRARQLGLLDTEVI